MYRAFLTTIVASLALILGSGCNEDDCPVGQVMYDGECVDVIPTTTEDGSPICGWGTYEMLGECLPDPDVVCGPNTEAVYLLDASGVETLEFECVGQDTEGAPPECPDSPDGEVICVNGWARYLVDPEDPCTIMETPITFEGATQLEARVYDPMAYAINPLTPPLAVGEVNPADGTFKIENIEVPSTNFIAVVIVPTDDASGFIFAGFPYSAQDGVNLTLKDAFGITTGQNEAWSAAIGDTALQDAGCDPGATLLDCGTWVGVYGFRDEDRNLTFIDGVTPLNGPDPAPPVPIERTFYLNETCDGFTQPQSMDESYTNTTGIVFAPASTLGNFSGLCSEDAPDSSCDANEYEFPYRLGGAAPGAIFVQIENPLGTD